MSDVAVVGIGQSLPPEKRTELRREELIYSASADALSDAGLERSEIDAVVLASSNQLDVRAISSMVAAEPAGAFLKDEIKVRGKSVHALIAGALRVLAEGAEVVLAVSWSKTSGSPRRVVTRLDLEHLYYRALELNEPATPEGATTALVNYFEGIDSEELEAVVSTPAVRTQVKASFRSTRRARINEFCWRPA